MYDKVAGHVVSDAAVPGMAMELLIRGTAAQLVAGTKSCHGPAGGKGRAAPA